MIEGRVFQFNAGNPRRMLRLGLILFALWIVLELLLARLIAHRFGWGTTILLHLLKGGFGLILLGWLTATGLGRLRARLQREGAATGAISALGYPIASAVLIAIPGLLPSLLALALFSPSLRRWISTCFAAKEQKSGPTEIDLDQSEWQETRKPRRPRRAIARKPTLEGEPPNV